MNATERIVFLPDIQSREDSRNLPIDAVGIKGMHYPITIRSANQQLPTVATLSLTIGLSAAAKGTHMSRFVELLAEWLEAMDQMRFKASIVNMLERLDARSGTIEMHFPYFARKTAPVSRMQSLLDHEVCWRASVCTDVTLLLNQEPQVGAYVVKAENFESIHNHSAVARITRPTLAFDSEGRGAGPGRQPGFSSTKDSL